MSNWKQWKQVQTKYFPCIADARMYFFQEGYLTVDTDFYHEKMQKIVNLQVVGEVYIDQCELTKAKAREFHKVV